LSNNKLTQLDRDAFRSLTNLAEIFLFNNQIERIDKETFYGLCSLTKIDLNFNQITQIDKETFHGLINLTEICLVNNQITQIDKETFYGLASLTKIDLYGNVTKIGGVKYKTQGAIKAGVKTIFYPNENKEDLEKTQKELPEIFTTDIKCFFVEHVLEVAEKALIDWDTKKFLVHNKK
jgi:Leucine-rich repeat (LRR) protein